MRKQGTRYSNRQRTVTETRGDGCFTGTNNNVDEYDEDIPGQREVCDGFHHRCHRQPSSQPPPWTVSLGTPTAVATTCVELQGAEYALAWQAQHQQQQEELIPTEICGMLDSCYAQRQLYKAKHLRGGRVKQLDCSSRAFTSLAVSKEKLHESS